MSEGVHGGRIEAEQTAQGTFCMGIEKERGSTRPRMNGKKAVSRLSHAHKTIAAPVYETHMCARAGDEGENPP